MLSIAVCDDEMLACGRIARDIKVVLDELRASAIIRQFNSGKDLVQAGEAFDIIFLDIMMGGMDGLRTAQLLRDKAYDKILIFITSSREYVFAAYDVEAFQYLVKPVNHNQLQKVLQRALGKLGHGPDEFIIISKDRQNKKLLLRDIYYFEVRGRIIYAHGASGSFEYYGQIGALERALKEKGFCRCHKSFLINLRHVDLYGRQEAVLDNGEKVVISKRRYEAFCKDILEYMRKSGGCI